jgi:hypothetical protein
MVTGPADPAGLPRGRATIAATPGGAPWLELGLIVAKTIELHEAQGDARPRAATPRRLSESPRGGRVHPGKPYGGRRVHPHGAGVGPA